MQAHNNSSNESIPSNQLITKVIKTSLWWCAAFIASGIILFGTIYGLHTNSNQAVVELISKQDKQALIIIDDSLLAGSDSILFSQYKSVPLQAKELTQIDWKTIPIETVILFEKLKDRWLRHLPFQKKQCINTICRYELPANPNKKTIASLLFFDSSTDAVLQKPLNTFNKCNYINWPGGLRCKAGHGIERGVFPAFYDFGSGYRYVVHVPHRRPNISKLAYSISKNSVLDLWIYENRAKPLKSKCSHRVFIADKPIFPVTYEFGYAHYHFVARQNSKLRISIPANLSFPINLWGYVKNE